MNVNLKGMANWAMYNVEKMDLTQFTNGSI